MRFVNFALMVNPIYRPGNRRKVSVICNISEESYFQQNRSLAVDFCAVFHSPFVFVSRANKKSQFNWQTCQQFREFMLFLTCIHTHTQLTYSEWNVHRIRASVLAFKMSHPSSSTQSAQSNKLSAKVSTTKMSLFIDGLKRKCNAKYFGSFNLFSLKSENKLLW